MIFKNKNVPSFICYSFWKKDYSIYLKKGGRFFGSMNFTRSMPKKIEEGVERIHLCMHF